MEATQDLIAQADQLRSSFEKLRKEIKKVIVGQDEIVEQIFISLLSQGHCLLVGVPGLAKTLLIKTLSDCLDLDYNRIQFTPDLMPGDITGTEIIEEDRAKGTREFKFVKGPLFSNIILADEINRTPPKTQSALLQAMQEYKVTASGQTFDLPQPFFVLATQNPIEQEGTYPLPEAQLDRFMMNLWLDYPAFDQEVEVVRNTTAAENVKLKTIIDGKSLLKYQELVKMVPVADNVIEYAVKLVGSTRPSKNGDNPDDIATQYLSWGAGPRASQYLILGAKAISLLNGRGTPLIEDVQKMAIPVLRHRLVANFNADAEGIDTVEVINRLVAAN